MNFDPVLMVQEATIALGLFAVALGIFVFRHIADGI